MTDFLSQLNIDPNHLWNLTATWGIKIILALLTLLIGWKVSNWIGKLIGKALDKRKVDATLKPFLTTLISTMIKAGVAVSAIQTAGVQATSFAAILAAAGLAIGMALSGTLQNFAGGVILLLLRPFKVGDVIETQGFTGSVREIQIFNTLLTTGDNKVITIPNGKLSNDSITNYSAMPTRRVDFSFGIGYDDDIDKARRVILDVISRIDDIESTPEPMVKVGALADSSVNFTVRVWTLTPKYWDVHFAMNEEIKKALDAAGISIPYPTSEVHYHGLKGASEAS
ncbi:MAG: mechanosensitive ion channel family protein [Verrucomicrobiales bacterium]